MPAADARLHAAPVQRHKAAAARVHLAREARAAHAVRVTATRLPDAADGDAFLAAAGTGADLSLGTSGGTGRGVGGAERGRKSVGLGEMESEEGVEEDDDDKDGWAAHHGRGEVWLLKLAR